MENLLGFRPKEIHYYQEAFTLGTARCEGTAPHVSYERLEFLAMPYSVRSSLTLSSYKPLTRTKGI